MDDAATLVGARLLARRWWEWGELCAALVLTVFLVVLHVRHFARAGPLWRDEISTVEISNIPAVGVWYHNKVNDWAPMLWDATVRAWTWAGPGQTDRGLRVLGLGVGLGITGALWLNARLFLARTPIVSIVLLGMNGLAVFFGDSLRAYGPGMLAGLLATGAMFNLSVAANRSRLRARYAWASASALAAAHTSYFDAPWLLAICLGGAVLCALHGRWTRAAGIVCIGAVCAASLSIYLPVAAARAGMRQLLYTTTLPQVIAAVQLAINRQASGDAANHFLVWGLAVVAAAGVGCRGWFALRSRKTAEVSRQRDAVAFSMVTLLAGVTAYIGTLWISGDYLVSWHFLVLFALTASCIDGLLSIVAKPGRRLLITAVACGVAVSWGNAAWRDAGVRMSNIDLVTERLQPLAHAGDLIVVDPWWLGGSVARYYHGAGEVITLPPLPPARFQRFDLAMPMLDDPHAIDPVLARLSAAALNGQRVWFIMHSSFNLAANPHTPLPTPSSSWDDSDYYTYWTTQVSLLIQRDLGVRRVRVLSLTNNGDVNPYENLQLLEPIRQAQ